jgi:hypothetical protein
MVGGRMLWNYIENMRFKKYIDIKVSDEAGSIIFKKLFSHFCSPARHFPPPNLPRIVFWGGRQSGRASSLRVRLAHNPCILLIAHEFGHIYVFHKHNHNMNAVRHGTKKWYRYLQRIINYGDKRNWWADEIARRTTPKDPKPEPSKNEQRDERIRKSEEKIKRYASKLKLYQGKLNREKRRLKALQRYREKGGKDGVLLPEEKREDTGVERCGGLPSCPEALRVQGVQAPSNEGM